MSDDPGKDELDAKLFRPLPATPNTGSTEVGGKFSASSDDNGDRYSMNYHHRGQFIIINNVDFSKDTGMSQRSGSDVDADNLKSDFEKLGFTVHSYRNKTAVAMLRLMTDASKLDHSSCACFGAAVLSHGDDSVLFGTDTIIPVENFVAPIKSCLTLAGKPKIFIFQACRGDKFDDCINKPQADPLTVEPPAVRIPLEADFLYAYSTVQGYYSWRNSEYGSWFIQALHTMMDKFGTSIDFVKLLTRVNRSVAYDFESRAAQHSMSRKKQCPSIVSMLTKDLYFTSK